MEVNQCTKNPLREREEQDHRTVGEDEGGEGEVEDESDLLGRGSPELLVNPVLDHPHNEPGEEEERQASEPKISGQWLQEDPHVLAVVLLHRHDHRHARLGVRQSEIHV